MSSKPVLIFRGIVLTLAVGYCIRTLVFADWSQFAGPFRFLTIWALFLSTFAASRMFARSIGWPSGRWDGLVGCVAVINAMVVYLYWRLYFNDPMSVTQDGQLGRWWLEYYMHALGPFLQWIDVLFIHRSVRKPAASAGWLLGIIALYVAWSELLVRRFATEPEGTVTSGLPYRFLNDLEWPQRAEFYGANVVAALAFLAVFWVLAWLIRRFLRPEEPLGLTGSRGI